MALCPCTSTIREGKRNSRQDFRNSILKTEIVYRAVYIILRVASIISTMIRKILTTILILTHLC